MPPRRHPASYMRRRSSGVTSIAARSGAAMGTPASDSRAQSAALRVPQLDLLQLERVQRSVPRGHAVVRRALEDVETVGLPRDLGDRLDTGRPRADDADRLAGEVDALVRPLSGVVPAPLEGVQAGEVGSVDRGEAARRHDAVAGREALALLRGDRPQVLLLVVVRLGDPRLELDVAP